MTASEEDELADSETFSTSVVLLMPAAVATEDEYDQIS